MNLSLPRLDVTEIFCDIDDFYPLFEEVASQSPQLPSDGQANPYSSRLSVSEVMTIVVAFHSSGFQTFKDFYTCQGLPTGAVPFPTWLSDSRFVELVPWSVSALACFSQVTFY